MVASSFGEIFFRLEIRPDYKRFLKLYQIINLLFFSLNPPSQPNLYFPNPHPPLRKKIFSARERGNLVLEGGLGNGARVQKRVNPHAKKFYSFCPGWTIDPGCYRKSLWAKAGKANGPETWEDLLTCGGKIKKEQGIQLGIGLSQELDSNMAARALIAGRAAFILNSISAYRSAQK
jgi:hypothetical protein